MRFSKKAQKPLCIAAATLAAVLAFNKPLIEKVFAQDKQDSAQVQLSSKERRSLIKNFEKAVKNGNVEKAEELLNHPEGVITEKEITAALFIASKRGNLEMVKFLVDVGADVNAFDMNSFKTRETGWTALVYAAVNDHMEVVRYFVEELEMDVDQRDGLGCTALMNTSHFRKTDYEKNYEMIEYLILQGADVNAASDNGSTAFLGTAVSGRIDVARMLLQNGAKPDARTTDYGDTAIYRTVERDQYDFLEFLLSLGVNIDVQDDFGVTPLMKAAGNGSINSVKMLVAKGAGVNLQDDEGRTALIYAVRMVDPKVKELSEEELEEMRVSERNHHELKKKYRKESIEIIRILISSDYININLEDDSGKTALDHARDKEVKKLLKKYGAD